MKNFDKINEKYRKTGGRLSECNLRDILKKDGCYSINEINIDINWPNLKRAMEELGFKVKNIMDIRRILIEDDLQRKLDFCKLVCPNINFQQLLNQSLTQVFNLAVISEDLNLGMITFNELKTWIFFGYDLVIYSNGFFVIANNNNPATFTYTYSEYTSESVPYIDYLNTSSDNLPSFIIFTEDFQVLLPKSSKKITGQQIDITFIDEIPKTRPIDFSGVSHHYIMGVDYAKTEGEIAKDIMNKSLIGSELTYEDLKSGTNKFLKFTNTVGNSKVTTTYINNGDGTLTIDKVEVEEIIKQPKHLTKEELKAFKIFYTGKPEHINTTYDELFKLETKWLQLLYSIQEDCFTRADWLSMKEYCSNLKNPDITKCYSSYIFGGFSIEELIEESETIINRLAEQGHLYNQYRDDFKVHLKARDQFIKDFIKENY